MVSRSHPELQNQNSTENSLSINILDWHLGHVIYRTLTNLSVSSALGGIPHLWGKIYHRSWPLIKIHCKDDSSVHPSIQPIRCQWGPPVSGTKVCFLCLHTHTHTHSSIPLFSLSLFPPSFIRISLSYTHTETQTDTHTHTHTHTLRRYTLSHRHV